MVPVRYQLLWNSEIVILSKAEYALNYRKTWKQAFSGLLDLNKKEPTLQLSTIKLKQITEKDMIRIRICIEQRGLIQVSL